MELSLLVEGIKKAFHAYIDNIIAYVVAIILFFIITGIVYAIGFAGDIAVVYEAIISMEFGIALLIAIVTALIGFLILSPLMYGMYYMAIKGTRGEKVKIGDMFYGFKSGKAFVRSLIYVIVYAIVIAVVTFIVVLVSEMIGAAIGVIDISTGVLIAGVLSFLLMLLVEIFFFYTIYIYVMTPREGFFYALKESVNIGKSNIVMVALTIIISWILSILIITIPLGYLFGTYMLKELKPTIKDESGMESVV